MANSEQLKVGDVVTLNSGGIQFTVSQVQDESINVIWFNETASSFNTMSNIRRSCFTKVINSSSEII